MLATMVLMQPDSTLQQRNFNVNSHVLFLIFILGGRFKTPLLGEVNVSRISDLR